MRKLPVLLVITTLMVISLTGCLGVGTSSFSKDDLTTPSLDPLERDPPSIPGHITEVPKSSLYSISWRMTEVYINDGGAMILSVENKGSSPLFVYKFSIGWVDTDVSDWRYAEETISPHNEEEVGLLYFHGPPSISYSSYRISVWSAVYNPSQSGWYDEGMKTFDEWSATLRMPQEEHNYTVDKNPSNYYDRINRRVDFDVVDPITSSVQSKYENESLNQALMAYEWVRGNIEYKEDGTEDYWQTAQETLELRTGDCEDQAILMASVLTDLGLNARVNVIEGHAFPTMYVTDNQSQLGMVEQTVSSYYWTDVPVYFLQDDLGYWMVMDTVGFPYAGGLPALSSPSDGSEFNSWTFDDSYWLVTVDVTGDTSGWDFLPF